MKKILLFKLFYFDRELYQSLLPILCKCLKQLEMFKNQTTMQLYVPENAVIIGRTIDVLSSTEYIY